MHFDARAKDPVSALFAEWALQARQKAGISSQPLAHLLAAPAEKVEVVVEADVTNFMATIEGEEWGESSSGAAGDWVASWAALDAEADASPGGGAPGKG